MRKKIPILSKTLANPAHSQKFHSLSALSRLVPKIFDLGIYTISHAVNVLLVKFKSPIHYHFQMIHNFVIYGVDDINDTFIILFTLNVQIPNNTRKNLHFPLWAFKNFRGKDA